MGIYGVCDIDYAVNDFHQQIHCIPVVEGFHFRAKVIASNYFGTISLALVSSVQLNSTWFKCQGIVFYFNFELSQCCLGNITKLP